jgi:hypothetical protein
MAQDDKLRGMRDGLQFDRVHQVEGGWRAALKTGWDGATISLAWDR